MSTATAYARPAPVRAPQRAPQGPPLRRVEVTPSRQQKRARPKAAYAIVTVASLAVIFAAQLMLSIVVSEGAYTIDSLKSEQKDLLRTQEVLTERLDVFASTQNLAANAAHLGMVPHSTPMFLDLSSGAVSGAPGSVDRLGCGGACNLVANALLTGIPLVSTTPTTAGAASTTQTAPVTPGATPQTPGVVDSLPAPVTH